MKTHYAQVYQATESYNITEYSNTLCGLEYTESPISDNINYVSCKKCLRAYPRYKRELDEVIKRGNF